MTRIKPREPQKTLVAPAAVFSIASDMVVAQRPGAQCDATDGQGSQIYNSLFFVVEPAEKGVVVPVVDAAALAFGERPVGFQGIIDGDEIGTATSQNPAYRSREPKSLLRGH